MGLLLLLTELFIALYRFLMMLVIMTNETSKLKLKLNFYEACSL